MRECECVSECGCKTKQPEVYLLLFVICVLLLYHTKPQFTSIHVWEAVMIYETNVSCCVALAKTISAYHSKMSRLSGSDIFSEQTYHCETSWDQFKYK